VNSLALAMATVMYNCNYYFDSFASVLIGQVVTNHKRLSLITAQQVLGQDMSNTICVIHACTSHIATVCLYVLPIVVNSHVSAPPC